MRKCPTVWYATPLQASGYVLFPQSPADVENQTADAETQDWAIFVLTMN